jgi:hypothetical protein
MTRTGQTAVQVPEWFKTVLFQVTISVFSFFKTVDDVLFSPGNSGAVFVICFHFMNDLIYHLVAAQPRIGLVWHWAR